MILRKENIVFFTTRLTLAYIFVGFVQNKVYLV
jgi:hypothetical protein